MITDDHLMTIDIEFDDFDHLNLSLEKIRQFLDNLIAQNKISHYYIMRYSPSPYFLGVKFIKKDFGGKDEILTSIENYVKSITGFKGIRKTVQGSGKSSIGNESFIASMGMNARNELYDLLKRKPSEEELLNFFHYMCNPLEMDYKEEATFCSYLIFRYSKEGKI